MKNLMLLLFVCIISSCSHRADPDDLWKHLEEVRADMKISTIPEQLIFDQRDSIPVVINCSYKDSAFCCGGTELYFVLDSVLDFERIYTDSTYDTEYCGCGDTVYLKNIPVGEHSINGNLQWNAGDWTYGKDWRKKLIIK